MDIEKESRLLEAIEKHADSLDLEDLIMYFVDGEMAYFEKYADNVEVDEFIDRTLGEG